MEIIKNKFRDKIFGDEVEYIVIKEFLKETIEEQDTYIEELETEIDLDLYNGDLEE